MCQGSRPRGLFCTAAGFPLAWPISQAPPARRNSPPPRAAVSDPLRVCFWVPDLQSYLWKRNDFTVFSLLLTPLSSSEPLSKARTQNRCQTGVGDCGLGLRLGGVCVSATMTFCLSPRHTSQRSGLPEAACACRRRDLNRPGPGLLRTPASGRAACAAVSVTGWQGRGCWGQGGAGSAWGPSEHGACCVDLAWCRSRLIVSFRMAAVEFSSRRYSCHQPCENKHLLVSRGLSTTARLLSRVCLCGGPLEAVDDRHPR